MTATPMTQSSQPWTPDELDAIRDGLVHEVARLRAESRLPEPVPGIEALLAQTEHVLARLELGLHGVCEHCGRTIDRSRLAAYPRATLCADCVS
jgi:RNA polymerase-binding transcription factor DksA